LTAEPAVATLKEGDEVEFTCQGSGSDTIHHFEFRLRKDGGSWQDLGTVTATKVGENYEAKVDYEVSATGSYRAECRVCTSSDSTSCTQWGATQ
jgi:plastocyanin